MAAILESVDRSQSKEQAVIKMLHRSDSLIEQKKIYEAKEILTEILINFDTESIDASNALSLCQIILGNYDEAEDVIIHVLQIDPENQTAAANYSYLKTLFIENAEKPLCRRTN